MQLKKTVKISMLEGGLTQFFNTVGGPFSIFVTKFAILLGAGPVHLSILATIGPFSQLFQPLGVILTKSLASRKKITILLNVVGRLLLFPLGILPFILDKEIALYLVLAFLVIGTSIQSVALNIWTDWISDLIPKRMRGRFFSARSRWFMITGLIVGYFFSGIIDLFEKESLDIAFIQKDNLLYVFAVIFMVTAIVGIIGAVVLKFQIERPKKSNLLVFKTQFIDSLKDRNFLILLLFGVWWNFAVGIGAPFWQPFMIKNLGMGLLQIQIYGAIGSLTALASLKVFGILIDRYGNKPVMMMLLFLSGLNPIPWLFAGPDNYWIIYPEAITSGIMWGGAGIVAMNFVLSVAPKGKRQIYSGIFGAVTGVAMMITMLLSGFLLTPDLVIGETVVAAEQIQFAITGVVRWTAIIPLIFVFEDSSKPFFRKVIFHITEYAKVRLGLR